MHRVLVVMLGNFGISSNVTHVLEVGSHAFKIWLIKVINKSNVMCMYISFQGIVYLQFESVMFMDLFLLLC